jgi:hypothetical protein
VEGDPASERTEAWILFDEENLYFAFRYWDSHPERMIANEMRRDAPAVINNENVILILDTFHERSNGVLFMVNALGGMRDEQISDEGNPNVDWNAVWSSGARRFESGWTAEIAVPFKSLRYNPGSSQTWGVNLERTIRWKNERVCLAPLPASYGGQAIWKVSLAATLADLELPPAGKRLDYAIGGLTTDRLATRRSRTGSIATPAST